MQEKNQSLEEAKRLFMNYDGSRFYMSRDGVEQKYRDYHIEPTIEQEWLGELERKRLAQLHDNPNWMTVYFFINRRDYRYLDRFLEAEPLGSFAERCAYLNTLLKGVDWAYFQERTLEKQRVLDACSYVRRWYPEIRRVVRSKSSIQFVDRVLENARKLENKIEQEH
jgi:hypothetical protein